MSEVKWIKISTGIFDDEKIKLIEAMPDSDTILVIWIKLLALAGRQNDHGQVYLTEVTPYNDKMLARIFDRKEATVKLAIRTFVEFGMVDILDNQAISITNWSKHQNVDGLEKIRESGRERVKKFREKQRSLCDKEEKREDKTRIEGNVTVTLHGFEEFWSIYPKKLGKEKARVEWSGVDVNLETILSSIQNFKRSPEWKDQGGKFIPRPAKWLGDRRWLDDPCPVKPKRLELEEVIENPFE